MDGPSRTLAVPLDPPTSLEPPAGSAHPAPPREPAPHDWKTIHSQRSFYDEHDFLHRFNLTLKELDNRGTHEAVLFDISVAPSSPGGVDGNCTAEGRGSSSGRLRADRRLLRAPKDMLIESEQFNQMVNPKKDSQPIQSHGPRLGIM